MNYLTSDNVFLNNNRNNFYDGIVFDSQLNADIRNLTSVTLMAKRNFRVQQTVTGPINFYFPEANHNNNAGPTGGKGKTWSEQEMIATGQPTDFLLKQNYPNPFNPSTIIPFSLPKKAIVSIGIYDVTGGLVSELVRRQTYESGQFELVWNGADHTGRPVTARVIRTKTGVQRVRVNLTQLLELWVRNKIANHGLLLVSHRCHVEKTLCSGKVILSVEPCPPSKFSIRNLTEGKVK